MCGELQFADHHPFHFFGVLHIADRHNFKYRRTFRIATVLNLAVEFIYMKFQVSSVNILLTNVDFVIFDLRYPQEMDL